MDITQLDLEPSNQVRSLIRGHRIASKDVLRIMALCRGHLSHEAMGRIYATMGRGMTPEARYTAVMAFVGPLLAPMEGDESMREAFQEMMDGDVGE